MSPGESESFADRGNSKFLPYSVHRPNTFHKHSSLFKMKTVKKFFFLTENVSAMNFCSKRSNS